MTKRAYNDRIETISERTFKRRAFITFGSFLLLNGAGVFAWKWLNKQPKAQGVLQPLRKTLEANEKIFGSTLGENEISKTYTVADAVKNVRVNGLIGLQNSVDAANWQLNIIRGAGDILKVSLDEIKQLPKQEVIFNFKCIEGWNQVTHWAGVSLRDFMAHYNLQRFAHMQYAGLRTPDNKYYVGIDMKSFLEPQTILCYEMNGQPLPVKQGYPLRLIIPVKYGIKHLKCIGSLYFSNQKPPDYWAENGYDYYAGF